MTWWEAALLVAGGILAGIINTLAGGGSTLTVPLLVLAGVPGNQANGSNRLGILTSSLSAAAEFRRSGIEGLKGTGSILVPVVAGSLVGSYGIGQVDDSTFEVVFGLLMIPIVLLTVFRPPAMRADTSSPAWPRWVTVVVFGAIGLYGGAFQAGVGLVLVAALTRAGYDLVRANSIKVLINAAVTSIALPVFALTGNVVWVPAIVLAVGFTIGGWAGARITVVGGERIVRIVMVVAAVVLAGRLLGLYG